MGEYFFSFILLNFIAFAIDFAGRNVKFTLMQILKENVRKNAIVANKYGWKRDRKLNKRRGDNIDKSHSLMKNIFKPENQITFYCL